MECRTDCGACCSAISIGQSYFGMPEGKPAGVTCIHLSPAMRCNIFGDTRRPALCDAFKAEREFCGDTREQALERLAQLERASLPESLIAKSAT